MAKTTLERSKKSARKRKDVGEDVLRLPARPGTKAMLADLMRWHKIEQMSETMSLLIINAHALGPDGSASMLELPRHEITISPRVARQLAEFVPPENGDHD